MERLDHCLQEAVCTLLLRHNHTVQRIGFKIAFSLCQKQIFAGKHSSGSCNGLSSVNVCVTSVSPLSSFSYTKGELDISYITSRIIGKCCLSEKQNLWCGRVQRSINTFWCALSPASSPVSSDVLSGRRR